MKKIKKILNCSSCKKALLDVLIPEDNATQEVGYFIKASCPFCKDVSFKQAISKHLSYAPAKGVVVLDIENNPDCIVFQLGV